MLKHAIHRRVRERGNWKNWIRNNDKGWVRLFVCFFFARPFCSIHVLANYYHSLAHNEQFYMQIFIIIHFAHIPYCFFFVCTHSMTTRIVNLYYFICAQFSVFRVIKLRCIECQQLKWNQCEHSHESLVLCL